MRFWEDVARTRWGRYITASEATAVRAAAAAVGRPGHALDVGCGGGRWTRLLLDEGWSVTATDVDPAAIAICAARNPEADCRTVGAGEARFPTADETVDLLVCIEVVGVTSARWFAAEGARVLAPQGRLVTVVWNRCSLRGGWAAAWSRLRGERHPYYTASYRQWRRRLRRAGLEVESARGLCWFPFGRASHSRLVPAAAALERMLGLARLPSLSPWVLVTIAPRESR